MGLELARITSDKHPLWFATLLVTDDTPDSEVINMYGHILIKEWYDGDTQHPTLDQFFIEAGTFKVIGRIGFTQEQACALELKIGDVL